jgi:ribosomal protein S18 acetylase RimI-like enzyme
MKQGVRRKPVTVRVRAARRGDRAAVAALWAVADREHAALQPKYFRGDGSLDPRLVEGLERSSESRELFVAEREGSVVGFVLVEVLEPSRRATLVRGRRGHIDTLVVAEHARRHGCGRLLVEAATEWARLRRAEELLLTVWTGNREAERFYAALGMKPVSSVLRLLL